MFSAKVDSIPLGAYWPDKKVSFTLSSPRCVGAASIISTGSRATTNLCLRRVTHRAFRRFWASSIQPDIGTPSGGECSCDRMLASMEVDAW